MQLFYLAWISVMYFAILFKILSLYSSMFQFQNTYIDIYSTLSNRNFKLIKWTALTKLHVRICFLEHSMCILGIQILVLIFMGLLFACEQLGFQDLVLQNIMIQPSTHFVCLFDWTPSKRKEVGIPLGILPHIQEQNKRPYFPRLSQC